MEKYEELEFEVITFDAADIITDSNEGNQEEGNIITPWVPGS